MILFYNLHAKFWEKTRKKVASVALEIMVGTGSTFPPMKFLSSEWLSKYNLEMLSSEK